jgi:hypothetical protein
MFHNPLTGNSLDSLRMEVRNASYPNTEAETKAVTDREHEIRQMVQGHEDDLVVTAEEVYRATEPVVASAEGLLVEMSDLRTDLERAGTGIGPEHAARFESIRLRMLGRINELAKVERETTFHAAKVADPYGSLSELRRKYPQVVAGRRFS